MYLVLRAQFLHINQHCYLVILAGQQANLPLGIFDTQRALTSDKSCSLSFGFQPLFSVI